MKILGREVEAAGLFEKVTEELRARGIVPPSELDHGPVGNPPIEPRVDPIRHHLEGLEQNSDPTQGLPLHTHRTGAGRAVLWAKWLFRRVGQPLINEALGRQRLFNAHARDAYAELAARVERLAADVEALQEKKATKATPKAAPRKKKPRAQEAG